MTTFDAAGNRHYKPIDHNLKERTQRLNELGLADHVDPEFNDFAQRVADAMGTPMAAVNLISSHQYLSGLWAGGPVPEDPEAEVDPRAAPMETGYCVHVIAREKALALEDIQDFPRFAGDDAVERFDARAYIGAPLVDDDGTVLGTVCALNNEPHKWGQDGLETMKRFAAEGSDILRKRRQETRGQEE